jgi:hypothetical protein
MERVAFLIERTGERIECLLNPHTFTLTRHAGVRAQRTLGGVLTGTADTDNPLLATGGGVTELQLDLLFDVTKQPNAGEDDSVQTLTAPLWDLAENSDEANGVGAPPVVRFVWGKSWNIATVVVCVAERFEQFTPGGIPRRSWVRMRLLRCSVSNDGDDRPAPAASTWQGESPALAAHVAPEDLPIHDVEGGGGGGQTERIDQLAHRYYGDASLWRELAAFNGIDDPARIAPGTPLMVPPLGGTA